MDSKQINNKQTVFLSWVVIINSAHNYMCCNSLIGEAHSGRIKHWWRRLWLRCQKYLLNQQKTTPPPHPTQIPVKFECLYLADKTAQRHNNKNSSSTQILEAEFVPGNELKYNNKMINKTKQLMRMRAHLGNKELRSWVWSKSL